MTSTPLTFERALDEFRSPGRERLNVLVDFCGVSHDTALRWSAKRLPKGEVLNKVWYLLQNYDLVVDQVRRLDPTVRYLGELIAFDVLSMVETLHMLELKSDRPQYLYRVLQGDMVPYSIKKKLITRDELVATYEGQLGLAKHEAANQGVLPQLEPVASVPVEESPGQGVLTPEMLAPEHCSGSITSMAASHIAALGPLLEHINREGEAGVSALRAAVGDEAFYRALDGLKAMSSRRASEFLRNGGS